VLSFPLDHPASVGLISGPAFAGQVRILDSHADAAQARVDLVLASSDTIDAAYFIYEDDYSGLAGLYLLREASRRGVRVRLLVDSQWNKVSRAIISHLARAWRIDRNGRPEGRQERYPGVGFWKMVKVRLVRLILPFVRGQL